MTFNMYVKQLYLDQPTSKKIVFSLLALLLIPTVHYVGFIVNIVPIQYISIIGIDLATEFTTTLLFYISISYALAVVFSYGLSSLQMIFITSIETYQSKNIKNKNNTTKRREIFNNRKTISEPLKYIIFIFSFLSLYLNFSIVKISTISIIFIASITIEHIIYIYLLTPSKKHFIKKIINNNQYFIKTRINAYSILLSLFVSTSLLLTFYFGSMRMEYLSSDSKPTYFSNEYYSGELRIILRSGSNVFAIEECKTKNDSTNQSDSSKEEKHMRAIYFTNDFVTTVESEGTPKGTFSDLKKVKTYNQ